MSRDGRTSEHVPRNRAAWDRSADDYRDPGRRGWETDEPAWGIWHVPESQLGILPEDLDGVDVVELGCGTAYVSSWLARRGARPVGIDLSWNQLSTAAGLRAEFGLRFPILQGDAEAVPLRDASFDLVISEYGASIWCDPYRWIPEAARLLRPGGRLIFLVNGTILMLSVPDRDAEGPATDRLLRDYFGMHRFEWPDEPGVEFHLGYGDWIRLLRANGFEVTDLIEFGRRRVPPLAIRSSPSTGPGDGRARRCGRRARSGERASVGVRPRDQPATAMRRAAASRRRARRRARRSSSDSPPHTPAS